MQPFEDSSAVERIFGKEHKTMILLTDFEHTEDEQIFRDFAKNNKERIVYAKSKITKGVGQRQSAYLGVSLLHGQNSAVVIQMPFRDDLIKYFYSGIVTKEGLEKFMDDYEGGLLSRSYKSQERPTTNDSIVKTVVGKTYENVVLNSEKDVLLQFYAPWCGHSKAIQPKYNRVADFLKNSKELVMAQIDATQNEVPNIVIKGFPKILFYKNNDKENPIEFNEDRTEEGMIKFLKEHSSFEQIDSDDIDFEL